MNKLANRLSNLEAKRSTTKDILWLIIQFVTPGSTAEYSRIECDSCDPVERLVEEAEDSFIERAKSIFIKSSGADSKQVLVLRMYQRAVI